MRKYDLQRNRTILHRNHKDRNHKEEPVARKKKESLEELFVQLEDVMNEMEQDNVPLEQSFELYHKGMQLLGQCSERIDEVEKKILVLDENGETHEF